MMSKSVPAESDVKEITQELVYGLDNPRRGKAIIINHLEFENQEDLKEGELDSARLKKVLTPLGFEVQEIINKTYDEIKAKLSEIAKESHSTADCLLVLVLSHGGQIHPKQKRAAKSSENYFSDDKFSLQLIAAKDQCYDERELFEPFEGNNCPSLLSKPKIFFIEACRSDKSSDKDKACLILQSSSERDCSHSNKEFIICTLPNAADFLIVRATVDRTSAYVDPDRGSFFTQILCDELEKNMDRTKGILDLESVLLRVKENFVARQNKKNREKRVTLKEIKEEAPERSQMPCVYSTLRRKLYLNPKKLVTKADLGEEKPKVVP